MVIILGRCTELTFFDLDTDETPYVGALMYTMSESPIWQDMEVEEHETFFLLRWRFKPQCQNAMHQSSKSMIDKEAQSSMALPRPDQRVRRTSA